MKAILRLIAYFQQDTHFIVILVARIGASVALNLLSAWAMAGLIDSVRAQKVRKLRVLELSQGQAGTIMSRFPSSTVNRSNLQS